MAFQDLQTYYEGIRNSYLRVLNMFKEFDKEHKEGVVEDKEFKKIKKEVEKITNNYEVISYFFMNNLRYKKNLLKTSRLMKLTISSASGSLLPFLYLLD